MIIVVKNIVFFYEWDFFWKFRVCDVVVCGVKKFLLVSEFWLLFLILVLMKGFSFVIFRDDVVRIWDSEIKCLVKSLYLLKGCGGVNMVMGFDVDLVFKVVVVSRKNGMFSIVNLEVLMEEKCCEIN